MVQIVHLRRSKYQQRRCHKERSEVLCDTNGTTLVYGHNVIKLSILSTTNREWPFQNPEIANHPDADQNSTFDPPVPVDTDSLRFLSFHISHFGMIIRSDHLIISHHGEDRNK